MKKLFFVTILACAMQASAINVLPDNSKSTKEAVQKENSDIGMRIELRAAGFFPTGHTFKNIYDKIAFPMLWLNQEIYENLLFCFELGYLHKTGRVKSLNLNFPTTLDEVPLSMGLGYRIDLGSKCSLVLNFCGMYLYSKTTQNSPYFSHKVNNNAGGFLTGLSFEFLRTNGFLMDVFANYRYAKPKIHDKISHLKFTADLSGFELGIGLGYAF